MPYIEDVEFDEIYPSGFDHTRYIGLGAKINEAKIRSDMQKKRDAHKLARPNLENALNKAHTEGKISTETCCETIKVMKGWKQFNN